MRVNEEKAWKLLSEKELEGILQNIRESDDEKREAEEKHIEEIEHSNDVLAILDEMRDGVRKQNLLDAVA